MTIKIVTLGLCQLVYSRAQMWHNRSMTEIFRVRVDRRLLTRASRVAQEMGTTPGEIVRLLFAQLVKRRALPFSVMADNPKNDDLLDVRRRNQVLRDLDDSEGW